MSLRRLTVFCSLVVAVELAHCSVDCWAKPYAAPGFQSDRRLFPADPLWDGHHKVAFHNIDCTALAGNFRDTGSEAVILLFPAATIHKDHWPNPQLQQHLAVEHNLSSLAVDIAGRGESCGVEVGPGVQSTVILLQLSRWQLNCRLRSPLSMLTFVHSMQMKDIAAAARFINSLPHRYCAGLFGKTRC